MPLPGPPVLPCRTVGESPEDLLKRSGIQLPPPKGPGGKGLYIPVAVVGDLLYMSGICPFKEDGTPLAGKVTSKPSNNGELDVNAAFEASKNVAYQALAEMRKVLGSLNRVVRIVKVLGLVNATPDFTETPAVINGYTEVMVSIFGDGGKSARSAVGLNALPNGAPVEIEAIVQVDWSVDE